jgi:hypothetical protein
MRKAHPDLHLDLQGNTAILFYNPALNTPFFLAELPAGFHELFAVKGSRDSLVLICSRAFSAAVLIIRCVWSDLKKKYVFLSYSYG